MSNRAKTFLLIIVDILVLFLALTVVVYLRNAGMPTNHYLARHYGLFAYIFPFWIMMNFVEGLYTLKTYNPANLPISIMRSTLFSLMLSVLIIYIIPDNLNGITPKTNLVLISLIILPTMFFWRRYFFRFFSKTSRQLDTLLIGSRETLDLVLEELKRKPHLGYRIVNAITPEEAAIDVKFENVQLVAIERRFTKDNKVYSKIFSLLGSGIDVIDLAKFAENISGKIPVQAIDESWFIEYCGHQESRSTDIVKAIIDRSISTALIICLLPVMIIVFPILLLIHGRPIFFKQLRIGLNNKVFTIFKLRTMIVDAEKNGAQWAKPGDARITPLGKFLRKSRLDELPQLINIIRGDMSLIGPRPERPEIIDSQLAPTIPYYNLRHLVKPGVTGWAQVTFRYGFSEADSKEKLQYDLFYVKNRSAWLDLLILFKTIKTVITGAGQ